MAAWAVEGGEEMAVVRTGGEQRALTRASVPAAWFGGSASDTPASLSPRAALGISAVWGCVRVLTSAVAVLPLHAYRETTDGRQRADDASFARLLAQPAPTMTIGDLLGQVMVSLLVDGTAFVARVYGATPAADQLVVLPPDAVEIHVKGGVPRFVYMSPEGVHELTPDEVIVVRSPMQLPGSLRGLSPLRHAAAAMGEARALQRSGARFAADAARPGVVVTMDPGVKKGSADVEALREQIEARFEGTENAGRSLILGAGVSGVEQLRLSSVDADFVKHRQLSVADVCRIYGVPEHLVATPTGDSMTYSTTEGRATDFLRWSLEPWLVQVERAFTGHPAARGLTFEFLRDAMLRPTSEARAANYEKAIAAGWLTVDEVRELENRPPLPEPMGPTDEVTP